MKLCRSLALKSLVLFAAFMLPFAPIYAQESEEIRLELNKVESSGTNCVLTFLATSTMPADIEKLAYEFVIFDKDLRVDRMTVFDFRQLKKGKYRVRQFQLPDTKCGKLGRILINDSSACDGTGLTLPECFDKLTISNKTSIEFLN